MSFVEHDCPVAKKVIQIGIDLEKCPRGCGWRKGSLPAQASDEEIKNSQKLPKILPEYRKLQFVGNSTYVV